MNNLNLNVRENCHGNSAKRVRKRGLVPGVIYTRNKSNLLFEISQLEIDKEIHSVGEHGLLEYSINGEKHNGLIKDVQRDSISHKIMHLDIEEVNKSEEIETEVPIIFEGEEYLNSKGQVLQKERDSIKVRCRAEEIPKSVTINVGMGTTGTVYRFSDIEIGSEISIVDDINLVLASISVEKRIISDEMKSNKEDSNENIK